MGSAAKSLSARAPAKADPDLLLRQILGEDKGFSSEYNPNNVQAIDAPPARGILNKKYGGGGGIEYWPPQETGTANFPRPEGTNGKTILEIYDPALESNPEQLKGAIYGDLLHGMDNDPKWKSLVNKFVQNYKPDIQKFNNGPLYKRLLASPGGGTPAQVRKSINDMYIRGLLAPDEAHGEFQQNKTKRYSAAQLKIIEQMRNYIQTGKTGDENTRKTMRTKTEESKKTLKRKAPSRKVQPYKSAG